MNFDPKQIALFVALHGSWSTDYHGSTVIPRRFLGISIDAVTVGFNDLVREVRKLLPSAVAAMAERTDDDKVGYTYTVLFADPKDIARLRKQYAKVRQHAKPGTAPMRKAKQRPAPWPALKAS